MYLLARKLLPVLAALSAPASAQTVAGRQPAPAPGPDLSIGVVPIHENDDGQLWAATDRYKVSFDGDATFVPYLGSDYPENRPFAWHTTSVRVGESELLASDEAPARWHGPLRYEYRYGALTEAYDVLAEGLEQTFTIHRRPAGRGDLVVTGRVATELRCPGTAGDTCALTFADGNGHAITSYGAATVIDAGGRRGGVRTAFCDDELTLTVAASWLDDARFPLVVDPLLSSVSLGFSQTTVSSVDVAFSDDTDRILVAYTAAVSSLDRDLYAKMAKSDWSGASTVFSDLSTADTPHVRVAASGHPTNPRFAIVFQHQTSTTVGGTQVRRWDSHVRLRILSANTGTGFTVIMTRPSGSHDWRPDVGGSWADILGGGEPLFVVVFQREASGSWFGNTATSRLEARLMAGSILLASQSLSPITFGGNDMERPSISKSSLPGGMVAWQERQSTNAGDDWNVVGKRLTVSPSGLSVSSGSWISSGGAIRSHHRMGPQVGGASPCVVAFSRSPLTASPSAPSEIEGHSLCTERVDWQSGTPVNYPERTIEGPFSTARIAVGDCEVNWFYQSRFWAVTSHSSRAGGGDGSVSIVRVGYTGRPTEKAVIHSAISAAQGEAGGVAFDKGRNRWLTVSVANGSYHSVQGNMFTFTPAAPPTLGGISCSTASIAWWGSQQIGSEFEIARLTGAQPSVAALLVLALSTANIDLTPLQMPFCRALVPLAGPTHLAILSTTTNPGGEAEVWLPLPEHLSSTTLHLQWFYQQPNANPLGLVSTQRLTVPLVK